MKREGQGKAISLDEDQVSAPVPRKRVTKGRPKRSGDDNRVIHDALLAAADECITDEQTSNVPVRRIAEKAGVNQAMINYYFNNKDGLLLAIFENNFFPLVRKLRDFENDCKNDEGTVSVGRLISIIDLHFENAPSLFVLHKDMINDVSASKSRYNEQNASRGYTTIARIMRLLMDKGLCRDDISPEHAAYLICVLSAVHHVMTPIFDIAFRDLLKGDRTTEIANLATQLLMPAS